MIHVQLIKQLIVNKVSQCDGYLINMIIMEPSAGYYDGTGAVVTSIDLIKYVS